MAAADDLELWLTDTLRTERVAVLERLQVITKAHVEQHHRALLSALTARLCPLAASKANPQPPLPDLVSARHANRDPAEKLAEPTALDGNHLEVNPQLRPSDVPKLAQPRAPSINHVGSPSRQLLQEAAHQKVPDTADINGGHTGEAHGKDVHHVRPDAEWIGVKALDAPEIIHAVEQIAAEQIAEQNASEQNASGTPGAVPEAVRQLVLEHGKLNHKRFMAFLPLSMEELSNPFEVAKRNYVEKFVRSNMFECLSAVLILLCTLTMVMEIQYDGLNMGYELDIQYYTNPAPWAINTAFFRFLDMIFNCLFLVELTLRLVVFRGDALRTRWTWFDGTLVLVGWLDYFSLIQVGMNPMVLRVARLARMLRLIHTLQSVRAFETLFLLIRSIQASVGALFWSFFLLWVAQIATGILICQLLKDFIRNEEADIEIRREVFKYFGTFISACMTMFEITLANWMIVTRLLYTHVSEVWGGFFIVYRGCLMFAVMKVISAVFIAETTKGLSQDANLVIQKKQREKDIYCRKLKEVFEGLDESGDGWLSKEEFEPLISDDLLRCWLATLEIDVQDLEDLFDVLQNGSGQINIDEFAWGMSKLKGFAKSIDVLKLLRKVGELTHAVENAGQTAAPIETPLGVPEMWACADMMNAKLEQVLQALSATSHSLIPDMAEPRSAALVGTLTRQGSIAL